MSDTPKTDAVLNATRQSVQDEMNRIYELARTLEREFAKMREEQARYRLALQQISNFVSYQDGQSSPTPEARLAKAALTDPNFGEEQTEVAPT